MSAGDALLARRNEQEREQWKRQRDDVWLKAGVTISAPTSTKVFIKLDKKQRKLVATMFASFDIVAHMRPFSSLHDMGRRAMAGVSGCHSPSKSACRSMVLKWFGEYVAELRKELADIDYISLTSDGWTNYATEHFAAMTLHFIDRAFTKVHARCIACVHQRDEVISSEVLATALDSKLTEIGWPREKPIAAVNTDEGSNFRAMVTRAMADQTSRLIQDTKVICCDHLMKTSFEHALRRCPVVSAMFDRCEKISSICRRTRAIKMMLQDEQRALHRRDPSRPQRCTPILPVITRWGSHYDSMVRLIALRDALNAVYGSLARTHGPNAVLTVYGGKYRPFVEALLQNEEWDRIGQMVSLLAPFRSIMTLAQGEYYCTLAPTWASLIAALDTLEVSHADAPHMSEFKTAYLQELQCRFATREVMPPSVLLALSVDPRYKCVDIFHRYPDLKRFQGECLLAAVRSAMVHEGNAGEQHPAQPQSPAHRQQQDFPDPPLQDFDASRMTMTGLARAAMQRTQALVGRMPHLEMIRVPPSAERFIADYRSAEGVPLCATQSEVLQWFNQKHTTNQFKVMLSIARCVCFIPASSAPSERVASTAGQVYNKRRLRLHEPVAESIIVMHESRRFCARRIVETSPLAIQEIVRENLHHAGALSDEGVDYASESSQDAMAIVESDGSFASSDNE
jgi:hypothetical protein